MNAVFERDYVRTSVSARWLWVRAGFALAMVLLVGGQLVGAYATSEFGGVGAGVLRTAIVVGTVLVLLAAPGAFGASLAQARAQNTLPILFATPVTPFQLAWGAFVARATTFSIFILACWPPIALSLAFGGVRLVQILMLTAILCATLLIVAAPSFVLSAFARSTGPAVVGSYLAAGTIVAATTALGAALRTSSPLLATAVSPVEAIRVASDPVAATAPHAAGAWLLLAGSVALAVAAVLGAAARLSWESQGGTDAAVSAVAARGFRPLVHENPVLDRELRTGGSLRSRSAGRTLVGVLVAAEIAYAFAAVRLDAVTSIPLFGGVLLFHTTILVLASAAAGATSLASEKETGAIDLIRVTPLEPAMIVRGKLLGLARSLAPALAVPFLHLVWGAIAGIVYAPAPVAWLAAGAIVAGTWTIVGMQQSLDQRIPLRAVMRTMGVMGIAGFAVAGYAGMVLRAAASDADPWVATTFGFGANPAFAAVAWVAGLRSGGADSETSNLPPPGEGSMWLAFAGGAAWLVLHAVAAAVVYRGLARTYRERFEG